MLLRLFYQLLSEVRTREYSFGKSQEEYAKSNHKINVAIIGAGSVGARLCEEMLVNSNSKYFPYMFVDSDVEKVGSTIRRRKVYAEDDKIIDIINDLPIQEIVIAVPDATVERKTELFNLYSKTGCNIKIYDYPLAPDAAEDKVSKKDTKTLRNFTIEDLLFRESINVTSVEAINYYMGKTIMVTGGGGSIGSELCRQIAKIGPKKLIIVDIYENNAYDLQQFLVREYGDELDLETEIASVRDRDRLEELFAKYRPEIVFHAAAHKHVPLMEHSGCEAIKYNVLGTRNVADMAEKYGVERFLLISTDKAVNPTNIMGASKRLCEMVIQCRQDSKTEFCAVRFGNVLGSNGSVIPLFKRQIEKGGPITITDKRIIRYFMTIPEAVSLVMEAAAMAKGGELFVLNMGRPVKILDLAENLIKLSGFTPYEDIDIVEVGLRPGEKLFEELLMEGEDKAATGNERIFIERDTPYSRAEVDEKIERLIAASCNADHENIISAIQDTVPTYKTPESVNSNVK